MKLTWHNEEFGMGLHRGVPETSGVYVLAQVSRCMGLSIRPKYLYVGKSKNLRQRWVQHISRHQPNPRLNGVSNREDIDFFWTKLPAEMLDNAERKLIKRLDPLWNRLLRPSRNKGKGKDKSRSPP